jgi:hypothetical protein
MSNDLKAIHHHLKQQNGKIISQNISLEECYRQGNATEYKLEGLLSVCSNYMEKGQLKAFQKDNNNCKDNGLIIDNILCPISSKITQYFEPLPTWSKDAAIITIGLVTVGLLGYSLYPATAVTTTFKEECVHLLQSAFIEMKKDTTVAKDLIKTFHSMVEDMTPQEMAGVMNHFIENSN